MLVFYICLVVLGAKTYSQCVWEAYDYVAPPPRSVLG